MGQNDTQGKLSCKGQVYYFFASNVLRVREFIPATTKEVTSKNDLEIQDYMTLHVPDLSQLGLHVYYPY